MPSEAMSNLTRRELFVASSGALVASCFLAQAQDMPNYNVFHYCRSGKLNHLSVDGVFLGGLLIGSEDFSLLEEKLRQVALQSPLTRALRFSTSPIDTRFLKAALNALSDYSSLFIGVTVQAPSWVATPDTFEFWRKKIEGDALNALITSGAVDVHSLVHDWELDARVFATISSSASSSNRSFTLHPSEKDSSRVFQLSNVMSKSIANTENLNLAGSSASKNAQISAVLSHLGLPLGEAQVANARVRLGTLNIE